MRQRIVQAVSFSSDDPLVPKVKALVRARQFSSVVRQALTAHFERENRNEVLDSLRRIELRLENWKGADPGLHEIVAGHVYGDAVKDVEGTDRAANALDSY